MKTISINYKSIYYPPGGILLWIIIFLELITFGIALVFFVLSSKESPELFHESRLQLNATYGAVNTVFLLVSGAFMATTVHQFKKQDFKKATQYLNLTMLGGVLFLFLKTVEYFLKIESGHTIGSDTFFTFYWLLTGFHVVHVLVGLVILLSIKRGVKKGKTLLEDIEASAAFWHMCDLIWLLLFPVLYLIL